jgi:hypothetical protein
MNRNDYCLADQICQTILVNFDIFVDTKEWLSNFKSLYTRFNIQPGNLPAIADCNFEFIKYENISKFHSLYKK